jgi:type I restriction enzyme, S subunit
LKVKSGYKLVKILFKKFINVPITWDEVKGENAFTLSSGKSPSEIIFSDDGDCLFVQVDDMNTFENKYTISTSKLKFKKDENPKIRVTETERIIFPKRGMAILGNKVRKLTKKSAVDPNIMMINCDDSFLTGFLYYFLSYLKLSNLMESAGIPQLNNKDLYPRNFLRPPFPEQEKITAILTNLDELISLCDDSIQTTKKLKQGLTQKLLTKGIDHRKFKKIKTLFQRTFTIPESWDIISLYDTTEQKSNSIVDGPFGSNLKTSDYDPLGKIPVLTIRMLYDIDKIKSARCITTEKFNEIKRSKIVGNDIVMAKIGNTYGLNCIYPKDFPTAMIPANICKITIDSTKTDLKYLKFWFDSKLFKNFLDVIVASSAQPAFGITVFKKLPFIAPSLPEQQKMANILSKIDLHINEFISKKILIEKIKKELMKKLLIGSIRVKI